jgi:hypothetical protein
MPGFGTLRPMAQGTIALGSHDAAACPGTAMSLTAEQRRALALLTSVGRDGMTQPSLTTLGFDASVTAGLVNEGLATQTLSRGRAGGNTEVVRIRIKAAGRRAIKG